MSDLLILETLKSELQSKSSSSGFNPACQALISKHTSLTFQELVSMQPGTLSEAIVLHMCLLMLKYTTEAPLGYEQAGYFSQLVLNALNYSKEDAKKLILMFYGSALGTEIRKCDTLESLINWLASFYVISSQNVIDTSDIKEAFYLGLTGHIFSKIEDFNNAPDQSKAIDLLKNLYGIQQVGIDVEHAINHSVFFMCSYLETKNDYYKLQSMLNMPVQADYDEARAILKYIGYLNIEDQNINERLQKLKEHFGEEEEDDSEPPNYDLSKFMNPHVLDGSSMVFHESIYANAKNPKFGVTIYRATTSHGEVAVKEYVAKSELTDLQKMNREIEINTILSSLASPHNCFLKFYGFAASGKKLYLYMEYHQYNLMDVISNMKAEAIKSNTKPSFPEDILKTQIYKLVSSFAVMEENKIYHQDIKPLNILVTKDFELKIIDFSISEIKQTIDATVSQTGIFYIQGTQGYMAPELEENYHTSERKGKFRRNKADVFSLGLTILQMYTFEELHTLNLRQTHPRLMEKVNQVQLPWLRTLLSNMLALDYHQRPTFKACLRYIPSADTATTRV